MIKMACTYEQALSVLQKKICKVLNVRISMTFIFLFHHISWQIHVEAPANVRKSDQKEPC